MSENCDAIVFLGTLGQFGAVRIPDTKSAEVKTENRTKKSFTQLSHYCFE